VIEGFCQIFNRSFEEPLFGFSATDAQRVQSFMSIMRCFWDEGGKPNRPPIR
jgi:hypothetical protein